jgi:hypothetical protein
MLSAVRRLPAKSTLALTSRVVAASICAFALAQSHSPAIAASIAVNAKDASLNVGIYVYDTANAIAGNIIPDAGAQLLG